MNEAIRKIAAEREREARQRAWRKALHYLRMFAGYVGGALAAGSVLTLCVGASDPQEFARASERGAIIIAPLLFTFFILIVAALPALVLAVVAERRRIRTPFYYVISSAILAVGAYAAVFYREPMDQGGFGGVLPMWLWVGVAFGLAGASAGFVYWFIAGKRAGFPRRPTVSADIVDVTPAAAAPPREPPREVNPAHERHTIDASAGVVVPDHIHKPVGPARDTKADAGLAEAGRRTRDAAPAQRS